MVPVGQILIRFKRGALAGCMWLWRALPMAVHVGDQGWLIWLAAISSEITGCTYRWAIDNVL